MPVKYCKENGKYRIGDGKCMYDTKAKAEKAYKAYRIKKHMHEIKEKILEEKKELAKIREEVNKIAKR